MMKSKRSTIKSGDWRDGLKIRGFGDVSQKEKLIQRLSRLLHFDERLKTNTVLFGITCKDESLTIRPETYSGKETRLFLISYIDFNKHAYCARFISACLSKVKKS